MNFADIQTEFREQRIGRLIYSEVYTLARTLVQSYNPQIYLDAPSWQEGLEEFVQQFVTTVLLEEGQLEYVMDVAAGLGDFKNLIARQMRRFLAKRRRRTVIDNLLDRCKQIAAEEPFACRTTERSWSYTISDFAAGDGPADERALRAAAIELSLFPVIRSDPSERAPKVYTNETLREILRSIARNVGVWVTRADLDTIFRHSLTFLLPSVLSTDGEVFIETATVEMNPEEDLVVSDGVRVLLESLTADEKLVLRMKLSDRSDTEIAEIAGVSRPTVDKRKKQALKKLEFALEDLPVKLQTVVIERVSIELAK